MKTLQAAILLCFAAIHANAAALDTVIFGNSASETAHALVGNASSTATGALAQPCRYLQPILTSGSYGVNGGDITVTMAVDPARRNHFTVKLWGGDDNGEDLGRLYLYVPLNGIDYQVGYRHEGDYLPLSVGAWTPPLPGRFFYSTTLLPLWMTRGKTSLTFKIVATGELYGLGSGGPPSGNYQKVMARNSRNIYRAYTHVDPHVDWADGEPQGTTPATTTRPSTGSASESTMSSGGTFFNGVTNRINNRLSTAVSASTVYTTFTPEDVGYLGRAYSVPGLVSYQNAAVVTRVVELLDAFTTDYYATPSHAQDWGGNYGGFGYALHYLDAAGALSSATLDTVVDFGTGGSKTRRSGWADALFASREYGRISGRRGLTNQATIASGNIYYANRGLLVLGDSRAFSETVAQRYLKDTCGLLPWFGNDLPSNATGLTADGSAKPYGSNYYQVTTKGLSREWGYVGAGYGELAYHVMRWYRMNGNTEFRDQSVKMAKARAAFRRPAMEVNGASFYRSMEVIGLISWRGVHECDGNFDGYVGYADTADVNERGKGMTVAAASGDPDLIGYAKQMLADNNHFPFLTAYTEYECLEAFADYQTVKNAADSGARLPMTDGQPDFVWTDEETRIVALKQGDNRLWITPYWHAQGGSGLNGGTGVNGVARFHFSTPTYDHYGTMETTPRFRSAGTSIRAAYIDNPGGNFYVPPDNPANAYAGEILPQAEKPVDASDSQPFGGKADFYALRYGRYLIGLNAHGTNSYLLKTPVGFTSGTNLVTGTPVSGASVNVPALTTVVIDTGVTTDPAPRPNAPLALTAVGSSAPSVTLTWSDSSGAATYTLSRSTTPGGPYTALEAATDLTGTTFTDTEVGAGNNYYYVVAANNANGASDDSMEASASAGVPAPWVDADIGAVGTTGSGSLTNGVFTVTGYGSDLGGTADSCHFLHVPMSGDGSITARLTGVYDQTGAGKVGLMMRQNLSAGSPYVLTRVIGTSLKVAWRGSSNANTSLGVENITGIPQWYRLTRAGNTFTIAWSADGNTWTTATEAPAVTMTDPVLVGIAVCSRNTGIPCRAGFDSVIVSGIWENPPAAPAGLTAIAGSQSAGLDWTASSGATSYRIKRSTNSGGPYTLIGSTSADSFTDNGLTNDTTYYYVVSALNPAGESADTDEVTVTPTLLPPDTPAGLEALGGNGIVSLSWNASFGATAYRVKRSTSASGPFAELAGSPVGGLVFTDASVTNGITYHYVVTALGAGGESAATPPVGATPSAVPSVPAAPVLIAGNGRIALSWPPAPGASAYHLHRATSTTGPFSTIASSLTTTSYLDTGLTNGTTYHYKVSSVNAAGESAMSDSSSGTPTTAVLPPPWVHRDIGSPGVAGGASYDNSTFTVLASGSDIGGGSDQFHFVSLPTAGNCEIYARVTSLTNTNSLAKAGVMIRKSLDADSPFAIVAVTPTTSNGVRFQYRATTGATAAEQSRSTGNGRNPPEWLRLVLSGTTVTAYRSNSTSAPTNWTSLGSVTIPDLEGALHIGLAVTSRTNTVNTTATFTTVTTVLATPPAPSSLTATTGVNDLLLAWSASSGATSYTVKRASSPGGTYSTVATGLTGTTFTQTGLASGSTWYYVVSATNAVGEGANSHTVAVTLPTVPTGLTATAGGKMITLAWTAFPGATGYTLKRSNTMGGPYTTIATNVSGTSWQDISVTPQQSHFYLVSANGGTLWQSYDSAEAYATSDMPAPWITQDIGTVSLAGSGKYQDGTLTVKGTGSDIGSSADNFRFACVPMTGDGVIAARITSQIIGNTAGKCGLMMRESMANNAKTVIAVRQANSTARFATRSSTAGGMNYVNALPDPTGITLPYWFKLERSGNTFTGSISTDGVNWTSYASSTVSMSAKVFVGFCGVSRDSANHLTGTFDHLSISGWTAPPGTPANLGATGAPSQISLAWSASSGATGYNIRRSPVSGGPYSLIAANHPSNTFIDGGLPEVGVFHYVVSALGAGGESTDSTEASASTLTAEQAWRLANFGSIQNSGSAADDADPDGDGWTNASEFISGTDPNNRASLLRITALQPSGNNLLVTFPSVSGKTYRVERSDSLGAWTPVQNNIAGTGNPVTIQDAGGAEQSRRFYRIAVW